jgi:hypothetical protein
MEQFSKKTFPPEREFQQKKQIQKKVEQVTANSQPEIQITKPQPLPD